VEHAQAAFGDGWRDCPLGERHLLVCRPYSGLSIRCFFTLCHFLGGCLMLKKPVQSAPLGAYCLELQETYPALADFLCQTHWEEEDGKKVVREVGSIVVFVEDGKLKCCLNDKDGGKVAFRTFDGPDSFFKDLDDAISKDKLDWRDGGKFKGKK